MMPPQSAGRRLRRATGAGGPPRSLAPTWGACETVVDTTIIVAVSTYGKQKAGTMPGGAYRGEGLAEIGASQPPNLS